jgi:cyanophycin synthetase
LLIQLTLDDEALHCLAEQGLSAESIPEAGCFVRLRRTANISTGGIATDVSTTIHPDNCALAVRAARVVGLDIAGIDFLCPDITHSWREVGGAICEINAQPGFRVHWLGDPSRDINAEVLALLYPHGDLRIPTAAITGTSGKSTVARMLHHLWQTAGKTTGLCTAHGVWVGHEPIRTQNRSGLPGAQMLFNDPAVEAIVIELPRKGLLQFGHPCDRYDVAALLNVEDEHIGAEGVDTREQMAELKAEVLERATNAVVINAEDALCLAMRMRAGTQRHVLVGRSGSVPAIEEHRAQGGEAVFIQAHKGAPWIVLAKGAAQEPLMPLHDIPATMNGAVTINEVNALFAVALAWAQGLGPETLRHAMAGFHASPE